MPSAALTSKGQITLPKEVRDHLRVAEGDRIDFVVDESGRVELKRAGATVELVRGILKRRGKKAVSVERMDAAIADTHARKR